MYIVFWSICLCILLNVSRGDDQCNTEDDGCLYGKKIALKARPQFVLVVLEGRVDYSSYKILKRIMPTRRRNQPPLGSCSSTLTIALIKSKTDDCLLKSVLLRGHEIIAGSKSYIWPPPFWVHATKQQWLKEQNEIKTIAKNLEVSGAKAPHFAIGGDAQYEALSEMNISYDISTIHPWSERLNQPLWPYKLNSSSAWRSDECGKSICKGRICWKPKCPKNSYPIWEFPAFEIQDDIKNQTCTTLEFCEFDNVTHVEKVLYNQYLKFNETNRAPFIIHLNIKDLAKRSIIIEGVDEFLRKRAQDKREKNFFMLSARQLLSYIENPLPLQDLASFKLKCPNTTMIDSSCKDDIPELEFDRENGLPVFKFLGNGIGLFLTQTFLLIFGFIYFIVKDNYLIDK